MVNIVELSALIKAFKEYNLAALNQYSEIISSKDSDGRIFPPYVPLIGNEYDKYKILLYARAESIPVNSSVAMQYAKHFDKLSERLSYFWEFDRKYPDITFDDVLIAPYQFGILPAMAGILYFLLFNETYRISMSYKIKLRSPIIINLLSIITVTLIPIPIFRLRRIIGN